MADVSTATKQAQVTFLLATSASATEPTETRTLSFDLNSSETAADFKTRATAFKTNYMSNFANNSSPGTGHSGRGQAIGSLIQTTSWRDMDSTSPPLACIGVEITFIDTSKTKYDI